MISLHKKEMPDILKEKGEEWAGRLLDYVKEKKKIPPSLYGHYRHPALKNALLEETFHKCAYCESKITHIDYGDVEHILPKSKNPEQTFRWENLTIACGKCNQSKSDYDNPALPLLNPYIDHPETEILFLGPIPFANPKNDRALFSIKKLKLGRIELVEKRNEYIERVLAPLLQLYEKIQHEALKKEIEQDILALKEPSSEFSSMSAQILDKYKLI